MAACKKNGCLKFFKKRPLGPAADRELNCDDQGGEWTLVKPNQDPPASNLPPGPSDISDSDSSLREYIDAGELASGDTLYIPAPAHPGTWKLGRIIEYDNHHVMIMMFYTAEEMQLTPPQLRKIRPNELFASNNYVKVPVTTKMSLSLVNVTYLQKRQQMPADGLFSHLRMPSYIILCDQLAFTLYYF